jgi:hypothetical protein
VRLASIRSGFPPVAIPTKAELMRMATACPAASSRDLLSNEDCTLYGAAHRDLNRRPTDYGVRDRQDSVIAAGEAHQPGSVDIDSQLPLLPRNVRPSRSVGDDFRRAERVDTMFLQRYCVYIVDVFIFIGG